MEQQSRVECKGRRVRFISEIRKLPNGREVRVDRVVFPNSVTVLPLYTNPCRIRLIRQYRPAIEEWVLEAPAGVIDKGEEPIHTAKRELEEETGLITDRFVKIGEGYTSPGYSTEYMQVFLALNPIEGPSRPEEHEVIKEVVEYNLEDALKKIEAGEIRDIKTILAIYGANHYCLNISP